MRYNLLYIVPQTFLVDRRWNFDRNFIVCEVKNKYNYADMAKLADAHGSADDFNQSQLLFMEQSLLGNQLQLTY